MRMLTMLAHDLQRGRCRQWIAGMVAQQARHDANPLSAAHRRKRGSPAKLLRRCPHGKLAVRICWLPGSVHRHAVALRETIDFLSARLG
jgi:hypothetical protein